MKKKLVTALIALGCTMTVQAQEVQFLSNNHSLYRINSDNQSKKYLLLPVQESAEVSNIKVIGSSRQLKTLNVRLANNHIDYYVPLCLQVFADEKGLMLDIHVNGDYSKEGLNALTCWENMKFSDTFDMKNREQYRPDFHHTPVYGWMNDPNGLFYKDGVWNLYFQYNPYGSQWENMTWGHSTSTDLVHWKFQGAPIQPDAIGTIFSGSAVVDKNNTAGLGKGAVVALYTSAGENQTQSMAYSTDNGKTFTKYEGNPIITSTVPDFRDPHMFCNNEWFSYTREGFPYTSYFYCDEQMDEPSAVELRNNGAETGRGGKRPIWDLWYGHCKKVGMPAKYCGEFASRLRPDAGPEQYGGSGGALDQLGYSTLMFYYE